MSPKEGGILTTSAGFFWPEGAITGCFFTLEFLVWKMEHEMDRWTGKIAVVLPIMRVLYRNAKAKEELNQKAKLSIYHQLI